MTAKSNKEMIVERNIPNLSPLMNAIKKPIRATAHAIKLKTSVFEYKVLATVTISFLIAMSFNLFQENNDLLRIMTAMEIKKSNAHQKILISVGRSISAKFANHSTAKKRKTNDNSPNNMAIILT
jgi:hypothetical protein